MQAETVQLMTPGLMASELGVSVPRINYILSTRKHIQPSARAGIIRLYDSTAVAQVRHEINAIDARRCRQEQCHA